MRNRLSSVQFVVAFGVVSLLADFVYEGARSIVGPYLATLGASAAVVGLVTGGGEAVALAFRLVTGMLADRTRRYWGLSIAGYVITMVSVPLLAVANTLWPAAALVVGERFGKAVRTPARDTMLAHAAVRSAVPHPQAYDPTPAEPTPEGATVTRLPRRFWLYAGFTALTVAGYATFGVLSYHLEVRDVVPAAQIPVIYAVAMGADALAALASGRAYDRVGLKGLGVVPVLTAIVPFLSFSTSPALVWLGAMVWGAALGVHESTMRAAVADLVPAGRRGAGYGAFTAVYGLAWLAGGAAIGALYESSIDAVIAFTVVFQALALVAFFPLAAGRPEPA